MRRILLTGFSTLAALVILLLYPTSTGHPGSTAAETVSAARVVSGDPGTSAAAPTTAPTTTGQGPDPATTPAAATPATTAPPAASAVTVNGAEAMTRYGVVQVQVVITDGKITEVTALQ